MAERFDERAPGLVVADHADWQHVDTQVREVADCVRGATWHYRALAMFQNQDRGFARDSGDFTENKFVSQKITEHGDGDFREGLNNPFQSLA